MKTKKRRFYVPRRRSKFNLRAILKNVAVKQGAIATSLFVLQAVLIACSSDGSASVQCFLEPYLDECESVTQSISGKSVAEHISDNLPGGMAIATEQTQDILDLCSEIRRTGASISREQWAWIVANDGQISLAQLFENVGQPLCKANYGVTVYLGNEEREVYAPVYIYPLDFAVGDPIEFGEVVVDPANGTPLGVPGIGLVK